MSKASLLRAYRLGFAILVFVAIGFQIDSGMRGGTFNAGNFFSFFTIESNIFAALVFIYMAVHPKPFRGISYIRGAAALYMIVTGVIYTLLLSRADVQTPLPWVNAVLHYVYPVVMLIDWLIDPPKKKLNYQRCLWWLVFPAAYAIYSLIRGAIVHWYPYPFLDAARLGYLQTIVNCLFVAICVAGLGALLVYSAQKLHPGIS